MNNFKRLASNLNLDRLAYQIHQHRDRFTGVREDIQPDQPGYTHRASRILAMRVTPMPDDVLTNPESYQKASDALFAYSLDTMGLLSEAKPMIYAIMSAVNGTHLGRVAIIDLPAGKVIDPHYDTGLSTEFYDRYHVMIAGAPENEMHCGEGGHEEMAEMLSGEAWWFNCRRRHSLINNSAESRLYLNLDISSL